MNPIGTKQPFNGRPKNSHLPEDQLLAYMWNLIRRNLKITDAEFERCLNDYLEDPRNVPEPEKLSSTRACIKRQLSELQMTMKTFTKGLKIIKVAEFDLIMNTRRSGRTDIHHHALHVNLEKLIPKTNHDDNTANTAAPQEETNTSDSSSGADPAE